MVSKNEVPILEKEIMDHFMVSSKLMIYLAVFNHNYMNLGEMSEQSIIKLIKAMI